MAVAPVGLILRMFVCILFFADLGSRWVPRPRPLCGCGPLVGLMWLVFLFVFLCVPKLMGASPSAPVWLWTPCATDLLGFIVCS